MRRVTVAVVLLALASTVGHMTAAGAANAKARCRHLITDTRGDAYSWFLPTRPYNPEADLLFLDAATTRTTVDFTVTMAAVDDKPVSGTSVIIYFWTDHQGARSSWSIGINNQMDGASFSLQNDDTNAVMPLSGAVDTTADTYVVHLPRARVGAAYTGAWLNGLGVIVGQTPGVTLASGGFIEQSTGPDHRYHVGYPYSCHH